jgi:hypothetical protein
MSLTLGSLILWSFYEVACNCNHKKKRHIMQRCAICDYTQEEGSDYADLQPGLLKVRSTPHGEFLCDACQDSVDENVYDLGADDIDPEDVE